MNSTAGVIYDTEEMNRINAMIDRQSAEFINSEKTIELTPTLIAGAVVVVGLVLTILTVKKMMR